MAKTNSGLDAKKLAEYKGYKTLTELLQKNEKSYNEEPATPATCSTATCPPCRCPI